MGGLNELVTVQEFILKCDFATDKKNIDSNLKELIAKGL